jgi:putative transposase
MFIEQEKANHAVGRICRVLGVSRSGYYAWCRCARSAREEADEELLDKIRAIHEQSRGIYGAPRIHAELRKKYQVYCSRKRVARLMKQSALVGVHRRKYQGTTQRDPKRKSYPDLVERQFDVCAPNALWVADVTQHETDAGWLYLATILDAYSRMVVGWAIDEQFTAELVLSALEMALCNRQPGTGLVHHSDHGSQYASLAFGEKLEQAGILGSMGSVGDALDNALAESFFATLQTELLDRYSWSSRGQLRSAIFEYIEVFYNRQRRHSSLAYLSPQEFELRAQEGRYADQQAA